MSLEGRLEQRLAEFEKTIGRRLTLIEAALLRRFSQLEDRVEQLERHERHEDRVIKAIEQIVARLVVLEQRDQIEDARLERRVRRIERELRPHSYPATRGITIQAR